jgi:hypothetical protein
MTETALKILFFTPHVALWVHTVPEAYLARGLADCGHEIHYLTCGRAQSYCSPMTARRLAPGCSAIESKRVCSDCVTGAQSLERMYGFQMHALINYLEQGDQEECRRISAEAVAQRSLSTQYLDVDVGKVALYEFTLAHKKMSTVLTDEQWAEYGIYLSNALITLLGFSRHLAGNRPDLIATFSPQYSNLNSCMQYAIQQGVKVYFMECGTNLSHRLGSMRVWDWGVHKLVNPALKYWGEKGKNPVTAESAHGVSQHFRQLLSGYHFSVFSTPYAGTVGMRQKWGIQPKQRVLLMTLSSYDEAYAAFLIDAFPEDKVFSSVFHTQADWLKATIEWVKTRPDLFLVVRVHPRDFPNKREQTRSEQSFMLEGLLQDVPDNVHVNWPSEGVSLYEVLEDSDVILTGWSVTAMEGLTLGIPVVTYDEKIPSYPRDIMWTGRSEKLYFENVDKALQQGWSIDNVTNGFRWLAYNFSTCTLPVSERFGRHELAKPNPFVHFWLRVKNKFPAFGQPIDLLSWRQARAGARILSRMITDGFDAIPPVKAVLPSTAVSPDDSAIIATELRALYNLLYSDSQLPTDKPGLAKNIRSYLESRRNP